MTELDLIAIYSKEKMHSNLTRVLESTVQIERHTKC